MKKRIFSVVCLFALFSFFFPALDISVSKAEGGNDVEISSEGTSEETEDGDEGEKSSAVRYEAEEANGTHIVLKGKIGSIDYGTYSGDGFVGCIDYNDSQVEFSVTVETSGEYELTIAYATGMTGATFKVYNDAGLFTTVKCAYVSDWGHFDETPVVVTSISLNAGENKVTVGKGSGYAELDYIEIGDRIGDYRESGVTDMDITKPTPGYTRYEAEDGVVTDGKLYSSGTYSGSGYVGNLDLSASNVSMKVTVANDGEYEIGIAYAIDPSFSAATLRIFNDEGFYSSVRCSYLFGWGEFSKDAIAIGSVSLKAGENNISIWKGQNFAQIDFIEIGAKIGDYKEAGSELGNAPAAEEGYTRYEAEQGLVFNAKKNGGGYLNDYGNSYYSQSGFVGSMDDDTCYIDIPVDIEEDGTYTVRLRYATATEGAKIQILTGTYGRNAVFYRYADYVCEYVSEDWGFFEDEGTVTFSVGIKVGQFIRIKGRYAEIDYIEIGAKTDEYTEGTAVSDSVSDAFGEEEDYYVPAKSDNAGGCGSTLSTKIFGGVIVIATMIVILKKRNEEKQL